MAEPIPLPTPQQIVTFRALLIPLMRGCGLIVTLGIIFAADAFCRAIFGTAEGAVGWIPFVGKLLSQPIHRIEQKVSNYLGGLESHIDVSMGGYIHALADGVGRLASGEAEAGWATWALAKAIHATRVAVNALPSVGSTTAKITRVYKITKTFPRYVTNVYKIASHALPRSLFARLAAIAGTLADVVTWDIPHLYKRARAIERSLDRLWKRIRALDKPLVGTAFAGAVALALARLGMGWLKCSSVKRIGKQLGCRGFGLLEDLLAASFVAFAVADICEFANIAESVAEQFVPELMALVDLEDALIGCHGATAIPALPLPTLHLPPNSLGLRLAA